MGQTVVLKYQNYSSFLHNIPEEQKTHLHYGSNLISCIYLLVFSLVKR